MLKKILRRKPNKPIKSYFEIKQEWEKIQSINIKIRFKSMRSLAHDICEIFQKEVFELEHLVFYIDILKQVNTIHDIPRCKRTLSKMIVTWLDLIGQANVKVIKKVSGKINTETASIVIGDPSYAKEVKEVYSNYSEKNVLNLINAGKAYIFSTGSDGLHNIQIRIVESTEPVLSSKEYKCVVNSTETAVINFPTGQIVVTDPCLLGKEIDHLLVNVEPGCYKICVYFFFVRAKIESFYIVLCKTDQAAKNQLSKSPQFN